jgi:uncharacterized protein (DUF736 family)
MAYEHKPGSGSMFRNEKKESDNHPDYKGDVMLPDGTMAWLDAWVKKPEGKKPFLSVSIKPKQTQSSQPARSEKKAPPPSDFDDGEDLPF